VLKLQRNYRSSAAIVEAANRLIVHNPGRREKRMWTARPPGAPVLVQSFVDEEAEAHAVATWCRQRLGAGRRPTQLGVLYRARRLAGPLTDALLAAGVPFRVVGEVGFLQRSEVRAALAHLQLVANPRDRQALERATATLPGVGPAAVARIAEHASARGGDLLIAAADADRLRGMNAAARRALREWAQTMVTHRDDHGGKTLGRLVGEIVRDCGLPARLAASDDPLDAARLRRLRQLARLAAKHARRSPNDGLVDFLAALALSVGELPDENGDVKRVTLATIHAAKGLEWACVWACGWEEGTLPGRQAIASDEIADERRLAYVAVTRAREELVLSRCWRRAERWRLPPSRFLTEALGDRDAEAAA
jgi:DNA helicase-2/ATP-dependent DNA helicase PcrA